MSCLRRDIDIVGPEIAEYDWDIQYFGWFAIEFGAGIARFYFTGARAAVPVDQIAIVAFFAGFPHGEAVTADGFANAAGTVENGFFGTNRAASIAGCRVAIVTFFAGIQCAVAA